MATTRHLTATQTTPVLTRRELFRAVAVVVATIVFSCEASAAELSAATLQPVHPVLIRNEHGPLTRVVLDVAEGIEVRVTSFDFKLDGTDDLGDLESLSLFSTGGKEEFSSVTPIGDAIKPDKELTFRNERVLNSGKNVFWLSCRLKPTAKLAHRVAATCRSIETTAGHVGERDAALCVRHAATDGS